MAREDFMIITSLCNEKSRISTNCVFATLHNMYYMLPYTIVYDKLKVDAIIMISLNKHLESYQINDRVILLSN